jgi:hypothetical protein
MNAANLLKMRDNIEWFRPARISFDAGADFPESQGFARVG